MLNDLVKASFDKIAPSWPLQNLIAVNPLLGFENFSIEEAIAMGDAYFRQTDLPDEMKRVNIITIKWMQVYCDDGQATITMPLRKYGFYNAWRKLAVYDVTLHKNIQENVNFLHELPNHPDQAIEMCLLRLGIKDCDREQFLTILLTTLAGWASFIKYRTTWDYGVDHAYDITQMDYMALRIIITSLLFPQAISLLALHKQALQNSSVNVMDKIKAAENIYRKKLLNQLVKQEIGDPRTPDAQLVFCIDVRSEPFRRHLESTGDYQTFGYAGFFGVPVSITDKVTGYSYPACPFMLKPQHCVVEGPDQHDVLLAHKKSYHFLIGVKRLYQSVKYTFSTPFALVETIGLFSGIWLGLLTISPRFSEKIRMWFKNFLQVPHNMEPVLDSIPFTKQCLYAEDMLRTMGLTDNFAPLIVFCGHGSTTQNNAYATALDCGACGGHRGGSNARIMAAIFNRSDVREQLGKKGINIPKNTQFIAGEHNTTTDAVTLYYKFATQEIQALERNLVQARDLNSVFRMKKLGLKHGNAYLAQLRSQDLAQIRPEWGLSSNAAFIIAPRELTSAVDLDGRCFLHSYDYRQDPEGISLTKILTAPMVVAEWINMQYLFSTIDNVAYGSGSKITQNITGRVGVMQGNASDLMTGLPLQSLYRSDQTPYHEPQRLMVVVFGLPNIVDKIIHSEDILQKLFGKGWVQLVLLNPDDRKLYWLNRALKWSGA